MFIKNTIYILLATATLSVSQATAQQVRGLSAKPAGSNNFVVSWQMVMDSLRVRPNQTLVFTPVIEDGKGHTQAMRSLIVNGRKQHYVYLRNGGNPNYPEATELQRHNGQPQSYDYREVIAQEPWMKEASVRINTDTCGCGNLIGRNVGTPVEVNPHWERKCALAYVTPTVEGDDPVLSLQGKAYLDFPVNRTELHPDYHNNPAELHKIMATIDTVRNNPKVTITSISIHGYASPEGPYDNNIRLAKGRAATLKDYVERQYDIPSSVYHVQSTPEDWAGLEAYLTKSNMPERDALLEIVHSDLEPDTKDHTLKARYPEAYNIILNACYPYLRHSDYEVKYKIRPMTDQEAAQLIDTEPRLLSLTKMCRIARLYEVGSDDYNKVILTAANVYPTDTTANVNAANVMIRKGDLITAKEYLKRAGNTPEANNALGIIALTEMRYDDARSLFTQADQAGCQEAKKNLELMQ